MCTDLVNHIKFDLTMIAEKMLKNIKSNYWLTSPFHAYNLSIFDSIKLRQFNISDYSEYIHCKFKYSNA